MGISRRQVAFGLSALALSGCTHSGGRAPAAATTRGPTGRTSLPADLRPVPNAGYDAWVAGFMQRARAAGISQNVLDAGFRNAGYLPGVVKRDRNQTEFKRSLEDYLNIAASDERVAKGRAAYSRHRGTLAALEREYGVQAQIIAAIWGLESFYGERRGQIPVVSSTSTLAYDGRRGSFFEKQLIAALRIVQSGDISADRMIFRAWCRNLHFSSTCDAFYSVSFFTYIRERFDFIYVNK